MRGIILSMQRRLQEVTVAALAISMVPTAALGNPGGWGVDSSDRNGRIDFEASVAPEVTATSGDSAGSSGPASPYVWIGLPRFGYSGDVDDGNQGFCTAQQWVRVHRDDASHARAQAQASYVSAHRSLGLDAEGVRPNVPCPVDPLDEVPVALVEEFVTATVSEQLPRPTLSLPPGYAITGLRTYLITGHELNFDPPSITIDLGAVSLTVTVSATGQSTVDWGDGTVTTHRTGGTGYPDGAINHVYTDAGTVDITVTDTWQVSYEAGPFAGTISAPLAPVTLADVEIQQRQAVRQR
jgi:hypothetical protein